MGIAGLQMHMSIHSSSRTVHQKKHHQQKQKKHSPKNHKEPEQRMT